MGGARRLWSPQDARIFPPPSESDIDRMDHQVPPLPNHTEFFFQWFQASRDVRPSPVNACRTLACLSCVSVMRHAFVLRFALRWRIDKYPLSAISCVMAPTFFRSRRVSALTSPPGSLTSDGEQARPTFARTGLKRSVMRLGHPSPDWNPITFERQLFG